MEPKNKKMKAAWKICLKLRAKSRKLYNKSIKLSTRSVKLNDDSNKVWEKSGEIWDKATEKVTVKWLSGMRCKILETGEVFKA